ncbi:MAG: hypothetical protein ABH859_06160 [Pseudomonadota bacterium]
MISSGEIRIPSSAERSTQVCQNITPQLVTLVRAENFDGLLLLLQESCATDQEIVLRLGQIGRSLFEERNYTLTIRLLEFANEHYPTPIYFQYLARSYQELGNACEADRNYAFFLEAQCRGNLTLANQEDFDTRTIAPNFAQCSDSYIPEALRAGIIRISQICANSEEATLPEMNWPDQPAEANETPTTTPEQAPANYPYGIQATFTGLGGYNLGSLWGPSLVTWHTGGEFAVRFYLDNEPTTLRSGRLWHPVYFAAGMSANYLGLDDGRSFIRYEGLIRSGLMLPIYQDDLYLLFETGGALGVQEPVNEIDESSPTPSRLVGSFMAQLGLGWLLQISSRFSLNLELSARYTRMQAINNSVGGGAIHMLTGGLGLSLVWSEAYQRERGDQ